MIVRPFPRRQAPMGPASHQQPRLCGLREPVDDGGAQDHWLLIFIAINTALLNHVAFHFLLFPACPACQC